MNDIQNLFGKTNSRMNARIVDMASILIAKIAVVCRYRISTSYRGPSLATTTRRLRLCKQSYTLSSVCTAAAAADWVIKHIHYRVYALCCIGLHSWRQQYTCCRKYTYRNRTYRRVQKSLAASVSWVCVLQ